MLCILCIVVDVNDPLIVNNNRKLYKITIRELYIIIDFIRN
jgi:hypothetical protein